MSRARKLFPYSILDRPRLTQFLTENSIKTTHITKIYRSFLRSKNPGLENVPNLPKRAKQLLTENFGPFTSKIVQEFTSDDERTSKLLIELQDGQRIESVLIRYFDHNTLCVSSQIGCAQKCKFCSTGMMGLRGNLFSAEIQEQVYHAKSRFGAIDRIVFMGMGEPLANYSEVRAAIEGLHDRDSFNHGKRRIIVSTVGHNPKRIRDLATDLPTVRLAISLHAPNPELRHELIPTFLPHNYEALLNSLRYWQEKTQSSLTVEYILLGGVNSSDEHAHTLSTLLQKYLKPDRTFIDLIPYNPTDAGARFGFIAPSKDEDYRFWKIMRNAGFQCCVRNASASGQSVSAGCGQLAVDHEKKTHAI